MQKNKPQIKESECILEHGIITSEKKPPSPPPKKEKKQTSKWNNFAFLLSKFYYNRIFYPFRVFI